MYSKKRFNFTFSAITILQYCSHLVQCGGWKKSSRAFIQCWCQFVINARFDKDSFIIQASSASRIAFKHCICSTCILLYKLLFCPVSTIVFSFTANSFLSPNAPVVHGMVLAEYTVIKVLWLLTVIDGSIYTHVNVCIYWVAPNSKFRWLWE